VILRAGSGAEGLEVGIGGHLLGVGVGDDGDAGTGQDVEAEVAAAFDPFVVLAGAREDANRRIATASDGRCFRRSAPSWADPCRSEVSGF